MEHHPSSPSPEQLRCWRLFVESSLALVDVLDTELRDTAGTPTALGTTSSSTSRNHPTASP